MLYYRRRPLGGHTSSAKVWKMAFKKSRKVADPKSIENFYSQGGTVTPPTPEEVFERSRKARAEAIARIRSRNEGGSDYKGGVSLRLGSRPVIHPFNLTSDVSTPIRKW